MLAAGSHLAGARAAMLSRHTSLPATSVHAHVYCYAPEMIPAFDRDDVARYLLPLKGCIGQPLLAAL